MYVVKLVFQLQGRREVHHAASRGKLLMALHCDVVLPMQFCQIGHNYILYSSSEHTIAGQMILFYMTSLQSITLILDFSLLSNRAVHLIAICVSNNYTDVKFASRSTDPYPVSVLSHGQMLQSRFCMFSMHWAKQFVESSI